MLRSFYSRYTRHLAWLVITLTLGASAQKDVCVSSIGGLAGTPVLDGQVIGDPGWNNAVQMNLSGDIGSTTATKMLLGTDGSSLYVGLAVSGLLITNDTTVVIAFSATDDNTDAVHDWRIHIQPFDVMLPPDNKKNLHPFVVNYWRDSTPGTGWNSPGAVGTPAGDLDWEKNNVNIFKIDKYNWQLEFKIPLVSGPGASSGMGGFCLSCSASSNFRFYLNVLNTTSPSVLPPDWLASATFTSGQLVVYNGEEFQCSQATCTGATPPPSAGSMWTDKGPLFPSDWLPGTSYPQFSRVVYNGEQYTCNQAAGCPVGVTPDTGGSGWIDNGPAPAVSEDVWPPCDQNVICPSIITPTLTTNQLTQLTPDASVWGTGSTVARPACTGVSLAAYTFPLSVGVQDPIDPTKLTYNIRRLSDAVVTEGSIAACNLLPHDAHPGTNGPSNTFVAIPSNNMTNSAQVNITFRIADFGIPGIDPSLGGTGLFPPLGSPVPVGCDPTQAPFTQCDGVNNNNPTGQSQIDAFGIDTPGQPSTKTFQSTVWSLNYKQSCLYKFGFFPGSPGDQCLQVVMDSNDPNTRFLNHSVEQNMTFVPASTVRRGAAISGNQGKLPLGRTNHRFLLKLDIDQQLGCQERSPSVAAAASPGGGQGCHFLQDQQLASIARQQLGSNVNNLLQWIVRGYVYTGSQIVINGHKFEVVRRAGDFGYVAGHAGSMTNWDWKIEGDALKQVAANLYTLQVAPNQQAIVKTTITANTTSSINTKDKFAIFADIGAGIPHGNFSNAFDPGVSVNGGLEYIINTHFSAEGIFGAHHFPGKIAGDVNAFQFTGGGKVFFNPGPNRVFARAGLGGYHFDSGTTNFGGYVGGGILHEFNQHLGIVGVYTFHSVNTPVSSTQFSTVQGGIRYVFH